MQQNLKKIRIAALVIIILGFPTVQAEETETLLRWKNNDVLPGQLSEIKDGKIRWASPYLLDDLVLDINVLDSVVFPKTPNLATETFRVSTASGDVWIADLIGSDANTFLFTSKRHGQFRVKRSAVFRIEHQNDFTPLSDGSEPTAQQIDFFKPHVYMMNGQIVQGELFVQKDSAYVLDADGTRQDIDLQKVSRVLLPETPPTALNAGAGSPNPPVGVGSPNPYIEYPDDVVLHGKITQVNADSLMLQTAFADDPVTCAFAGASRLHFNTNSNTNTTIQKQDRLFHATGTLGGRVSFRENRGIPSIQWKSIGASEPVQLANNQTIHIRRFLQPTSKAARHFDTTQFPHALHLRTGETFPCHITTYDGKALSFRSPFVSALRMDAATIDEGTVWKYLHTRVAKRKRFMIQ